MLHQASPLATCPMGRWRWTMVVALFVFFYKDETFAATYRLSATTGVMQQPTSNYYHFVYGGQADVGTDKDSILLRASYFERPAYRSVGFIDKDYGWSGLLGTKLTKTKKHGLFAFIGLGKVAGYIKTQAANEGTVDPKSRSFDLTGINAAMEYAWQIGRLALGIQHQSLIAFADRSQTEAFVAWPYNLFLLSVGADW